MFFIDFKIMKSKFILIVLICAIIISISSVSAVDTKVIKLI